MKEALFLHTACCLMMTGLIWNVQIVHYPTFTFIDRQSFCKFASFHANRITWIVGPLMLTEVVTGAALVIGSSLNSIYLGNLVALLAIWICTALFSIPCHTVLQSHRDDKVIRNLTLSNWPRTLLWSARSLILVSLVFDYSP